MLPPYLWFVSYLFLAYTTGSELKNKVSQLRVKTSSSSSWVRSNVNDKLKPSLIIWKENLCPSLNAANLGVRNTHV